MTDEKSYSTIFSLSSGAGLAGVAIIRVSGKRAFAVIEHMCRKPVSPRLACLRKIHDPETGELLDEGLVLWFPGPATFTGEDIVELQIHGGRATIDAVIAGLVKISGFSQAEAGEFTRRAFMNGRLDLVEIEGLGDLIHAQTESQRRQAFFQSSGKASGIFEGWRMQLVSVLSYLEASIDFVEEQDIAESALVGLTEKLIHLRNDMHKHLVDSARGSAVRDGVRVVLAGEPNVGKSSILNYLANRDVAIVSDIPGTTRDVLEVQLNLAGIPVVISDTAGLREKAGDEIEQEGIKRTHQQTRRADLVIRVCVAGHRCEDFELETDGEEITVFNKIDVAEGAKAGQLAVSARSGEGMDQLIDVITEKISSRFGSQEPAIITRERQRAAVVASLEFLDAAVQEKGKSLELMAEQLRLAAVELSRLVGRIDVEDLLDVIFRDFCVGK
jgi:tRNA modification GTPase